MRDGVAALALGLVVGITAGRARRAEAMEPGTMIDQGNVDQVKDQLPPEIYNHFKKGEYANKLIDFPNSRWSQDDGFFFDGKPEDFNWKIVGHKDAMRLVDANSVADNSQ